MAYLRRRDCSNTGISPFHEEITNRQVLGESLCTSRDEPSGLFQDSSTSLEF